VGENLPDIDLATIEVNRGNETIFVASDVEDNELSYFVRRGKGRPEAVKVVKLTAVHDLEPSGQGIFAVRVLLPKEPEGFAGDHMHTLNISQGEIKGKKAFYERPGMAAQRFGVACSANVPALPNPQHGRDVCLLLANGVTGPGLGEGAHAPEPATRC